MHDLPAPSLLGRTIVDCSMPIEPHWRFSPAIEHSESMAKGGCRFHSTRFTMGAHGFTHVDAPRHIADDGVWMNEIPLSAVMGEAAVADVSALGDLAAITAADLADAPVREGDILLIRSDHASRWPTTAPEYWTRAPWLTPDAARWVRKSGVKAVGFDFPQDRGIRADYDPDWSPSADPLDDWACHRLLLTEGVLQIEYLEGLTAIPGDRCVFAAVPLKLTLSDGAPVRALAFIDSKETGA